MYARVSLRLHHRRRVVMEAFLFDNVSLCFITSRCLPVVDVAHGVPVSCSGVAVCYLAGEMHMITFDGQALHVQGECKYKMAGSVGGGGTPDFSVYTKNRKGTSNPLYTYTQYIEVEVYGHVIRIDYRLKIYVSTSVRFIQVSPLVVFDTTNANCYSSSSREPRWLGTLWFYMAIVSMPSHT